MSQPESRFPWALLDGLHDYQVTEADVDTACEVAIGVWGRSIGWPDRPADMYRRYYRQDMVERPRLLLLHHLPSGRVVGTLGLSPRRVRWRHREFKAAVLSHLCVVGEHRKVRPAVLLFKGAFDACRGNYDLGYAIPRTQQSVAFCKLLHMRPVCQVRRSVRVLRHGHYLGRLLPGPLAAAAGSATDVLSMASDALRSRGEEFVATWVDRVDPRMEALWSETGVDAGWNAVRDEAFLRWRFDHLLSFQRRYLLLSRMGGGSSLVAWFACDTSGFDSAVLVVQDFWSVRGSGAIDRAMVRVLCREVRSLGFAGVELRLAAPDACHAPWHAEGFMDRNQHPMYLHWLDPDNAGLGENSFHVTDLDNDG